MITLEFLQGLMMTKLDPAFPHKTLEAFGISRNEACNNEVPTLFAQIPRLINVNNHLFMFLVSARPVKIVFLFIIWGYLLKKKYVKDRSRIPLEFCHFCKGEDVLR